jgi:hypothetical protein
MSKLICQSRAACRGFAGYGVSMPRTDDPRPHHYEFAHRALPAVIMRTGPRFVHLAAERDLYPGLRGLWDQVGERLPEADRLAPDGLHAEYRHHPDARLVLVTMPQARHMVEVHFAVIAAIGDTVRYLTLEESWSPVRERDTVIGEWTEQGHLNFGPGPVPPDKELFLQRVLDMLTRPDATS